jgi:hypothetical protein
MCVAAPTSGSLTIQSTTFYKNTGQTTGTIHTNAPTTITDSVITDNTATVEGVAIFSDGTGGMYMYKF